MNDKVDTTTNTTVVVTFSDGTRDFFEVPDDVEQGILKGEEFGFSVRHPDWKALRREQKKKENNAKKPPLIIMPGHIKR